MNSLESKYMTLSTEEKATVVGGDWSKIVIDYIADKFVDAFGDYSTNSCRKNHRQWFCIQV